MSVRTLSADAFPRGDLLGNGGFGRSYACSGDSEFVLKSLLLNRDYRGKPEKLLVELDRLASVRSPVVARIVGVIPGDSSARRLPAIVTENFAEGSLETLIENKKDVSFTEKMRIMFGVASAMKSLHAAGIVHGDLKPTNVMMKNGDPQVVHFGLHRLVKVAPSEPIIGTAFRAPEISSEDVTAATRSSDVYAFGMMMYYVMAGKVPHGRYVKPLMDGMRPDLPKTFPHSVRKVIQLCWAHDPAQRPSFDEVLGMFITARFRSEEFDLGEFFKFAVCVEEGAIQRTEIAALRKENDAYREQIQVLSEVIDEQNKRIAEIGVSAPVEDGAPSEPSADIGNLAEELESVKQNMEKVMENVKKIEQYVAGVPATMQNVTGVSESLRQTLSNVQSTAARLDQKLREGKPPAAAPPVPKEETRPVVVSSGSPDHYESLGPKDNPVDVKMTLPKRPADSGSYAFDEIYNGQDPDPIRIQPKEKPQPTPEPPKASPNKAKSDSSSTFDEEEEIIVEEEEEEEDFKALKVSAGSEEDAVEPLQKEWNTTELVEEEDSGEKQAQPEPSKSSEEECESAQKDLSSSQVVPIGEDQLEEFDLESSEVQPPRHFASLEDLVKVGDSDDDNDELTVAKRLRLSSFESD